MSVGHNPVYDMTCRGNGKGWGLHGLPCVPPPPPPSKKSCMKPWHELIHWSCARIMHIHSINGADRGHPPALQLMRLCLLPVVMYVILCHPTGVIPQPLNTGELYCLLHSMWELIHLIVFLARLL